MLLHGPLSLDTPAPAQSVVLQDGVPCPRCLCGVAMAHLERHLSANRQGPSPDAEDGTPENVDDHLEESDCCRRRSETGS